MKKKKWKQLDLFENNLTKTKFNQADDYFKQILTNQKNKQNEHRTNESDNRNEPRQNRN